MKSLLFFVLLIFGLMFLGMYCESQKEPYDVGMHWDYSIICENGFIYKQMRHGTIPILNSDGTPLVCGKKIY
jgi:hypothetical protein